jgi:hypothetical protein
MRAISAAIVLLAGVILFALGFFVPTPGDRGLVISAGAVLALIGFAAWVFGFAVGDKRFN